jgi:carbon-monoxide dehydrogenase medium subunit
MIPAEVRYHRATSVDDALAALAEPEAKPLAGGQSLVSVMKLRIARPSLVVDIGRLDLSGVEIRDGELRIGALTTWSMLADAEVLQRPALAAIAECAAGIGDLQVRNRGTLGGSLAHADPASDMPAVLLALDARVTLRSAEGERVLAADELFLGPFTTALGARELLTEVAVPLPPPGSGSAYASVEHPASGFALAGAAALVRPDGSTTIALTGVGARPFALQGDGWAAAIADAEIVGDPSAPAEYRRHLARVVVERALERARRRAEEDRA